MLVKGAPCSYFHVTTTLLKCHCQKVKYTGSTFKRVAVDNTMGVPVKDEKLTLHSILPSVFLRGCQFFQSFSRQYMGPCVASLPIFSCADCENPCTYSFYHNQIGSRNHWPFFRARSLNTGMRCMSCYVIIIIN